MKENILVLTFFISGAFLSYFNLLPQIFYKADFSKYILYILLFLVGVITGANKRIFSIVKKVKYKIIFVPISTVLGTTLGIFILHLFLIRISLKDLLAVGWGFGYYSLSSIIIKDLRNDAISLIALLSNIFRELFTFIGAPLLVKTTGKLSAISSGGATSMDTTLPIITKFAGEEYTIISIFHGAVLTILVPIMITLLYK